MKIVAFLQNMWVKDPERVKQSIARYGETYRLRFMRYALFAGCKTGRVLKKTFGEELLDQIIFEETTREIAGDPKKIFPHQPEHIIAVLQKHEPRIVIAFGKIASAAIQCHWAGENIHCPHPAARQPDTAKKLTEAADKLRTLLKTDVRRGLIMARRENEQRAFL